MPNTLELKSSCSQRADKCHYKIYSDLSQITTLRPEWTTLLSESSCNPAFSSLEWYLASCRVQPALCPCVAVAVSEARTICILPLAINQETGVAAFPHLENDYNDILASTEATAHAVDLLDYLLYADKDCRQILLSKVKPDSHCIRCARFLNGNAHFECHARDLKAFHYLELPANFEDYLASRGKLFRRNVRRALRMTSKTGFAIRELRPEDVDPMEIPDAFLTFALVRHGERCAFYHQHMRSFARELLPSLFRDRRLRAYAMFIEERMIAIDLYLTNNNGLVAWNGGFLAEGDRWSPGTTLMAFAVRQAIDERLREVDFGEGNEVYKRNWTNRSYTICELRLTPALS